jgi:crossover junction endodeoxyribonuclease RusA
MVEIVRTALELRLPWPPSINGYFMPIRMGHALRLALSPRGRAYKKDVATAIAQQRGRMRLDPIATACQVDVELRAPDRRKRDIDGNLKSLLDALTDNGAWTDDSLVMALNVRKGLNISGGAALVLITQLDQPAGDSVSTTQEG